MQPFSVQNYWLSLELDLKVEIKVMRDDVTGLLVLSVIVRTYPIRRGADEINVIFPRIALDEKFKIPTW